MLSLPTSTVRIRKRMRQAPALEIRSLRKSFGSNTVLKGISLDIPSGQFVGLMGPNGAGKSTLIKILDGVYGASSGEIRIGGRRVNSIGNHPDVGFIHQDLGLVNDLSIADNLRLGERPLRLAGPILNRRDERAAAERALDLIGLERSVGTLVGDLAPGEKTLVAIARVFDRGAGLVFVDESTSTLPPGDARRVIETLGAMAASGATIVMVTHKLSEVLDATERVIVLLDGALAADRPTAGLDRASLVEMLYQHEKGREDLGSRSARSSSGPTLLRMRGVYGGRAGPIDLDVEAGTVTGITGLPGSGLHDVATLAYGSLAPARGRVDLTRAGVRRALVPPDRETQSGFDELDVRQNLTLSALSRWRTRSRVLSLRRESRDAEGMIRRLDVRPGDLDVAYGVLSGGNKQKVVFGRALLQRPDVYILCEPTRGVDVGTRSEIYELIGEIRDQGAAVLVVSSDAEDLFAVCDQVCVIEGGRLGPLRPIEELSLSELEEMV